MGSPHPKLKQHFVHIKYNLYAGIPKYNYILSAWYIFLFNGWKCFLPKLMTRQMMVSAAAYSLWMYSCKGSFHPVQMGHTSAAELFHQFSRWEGLLHSGNLSSGPRMPQTERNMYTIFSYTPKYYNRHLITVVKSMKTPYLKLHVQWKWTPVRTDHFANITVLRTCGSQCREN